MKMHLVATATKDFHKEVKRACASAGVKISDVIKAALRDFVDQEAKGDEKIIVIFEVERE